MNLFVSALLLRNGIQGPDAFCRRDEGGGCNGCNPAGRDLAPRGKDRRMGQEKRHIVKLLAVGNSFSQDALYYLHDMAACGGIELYTVNLYIGGCPLKRHYQNLADSKEEYLYEANGISTGRYTSANQVLKEEKWDYILTQQASHDSGLEETYQPYLEGVLDYFRRACPGAERLLQETWAYETDSAHPQFDRYHYSQREMYEKLKHCYAKAAQSMKVRLIPCADVIQALRGKSPFRHELGERSLCRDGFHMDMIYGRYALAAVFYSFLFNRSVCENPFCPEGADAGVIGVIKECVDGFPGLHVKRH